MSTYISPHCLWGWFLTDGSVLVVMMSSVLVVTSPWSPHVLLVLLVHTNPPVGAPVGCKGRGPWGGAQAITYNKT
jgi:hypothetical protein